MRLVLIAAFVIGMLTVSAARAAPPDVPCGAGGDLWTQAQALVHSEEFGEPIRGISARLSPLNVGAFPTCQRVGERHGTSAAYINLSRYDRRTARGGEMIQLGIWRRADEPAVFAYNEFTVTGGLVLVENPLPVMGHTYLLSIAAEGPLWRLTIRDETSGALHTIMLEATWREAKSGWLMYETYGRPAIFGGAASPTLTDMEVQLASGNRGVTPACSMSETWFRDSKTPDLAARDRFAFAEGARNARCTSAPFRAFSED